MAQIGHKTWAIAGGRVPLNSTGREPEYTSCDDVCILNTTDKEAEIELTIYYEDKEPQGAYHITVPAQRMRRIKFNDLIDPLPIPLNTDYACTIKSNVPIVVQFNRRDTSQQANAITSMPAFYSD